MTGFAALVLSVLLAGPRHKTDADEATEARRARLSGIATAIAAASKGDPERAALLIAQGQHETHWARYVGEGRCADGPKGSRCDPDRHGVPRARTYFQVWRVSCPAAWDAPPGSYVELEAAARCTVRLMASGSRRCRLNGYDPTEGAFAGARGGASCTGAAHRVRTYRAVLGKLTGRRASS